MRNKIAVVTCSTAFAALPGAAHAVQVNQGDDDASWTFSGQTLSVCDREQDGHSVYSNYYVTSNSAAARLENFGGNGTCATAGINPMLKFRVCENIPFMTDPCSSYV